MKRLTALLGVVVCSVHCSGESGSPVGPGPPSAPTVLVGAGDIAVCGSPGAEATAKLLDLIPGTVFTAGDNAYSSGSAAQFRNCYEPTWGRHKGRTRPSPGNHDYEQPNAAGYFDYFGSNAGPPGRGYYSYRMGSWHVLSLNSNVEVAASSPQMDWIRRELSETQSQCTIAYWHHPLFTSGPHGDSPFMRDVWRVLYELGTDVVINGHDHLYERFAPQDPEGRFDPTRGIRQFTVGTGGAPLYDFVRVRANSEARGRTFGVLKLTLTQGSYIWEFISGGGSAFGDAGSGQCH